MRQSFLPAGNTRTLDPASARLIRDFDTVTANAILTRTSNYAVLLPDFTERKPSPLHGQAIGSSDALSPMRAVGLEVGVVHIGRVITGTIVCAGVYTGGSYLVLEDVFGRAFKVGV
jgi:hypothetical protein